MVSFSAPSLILVMVAPVYANDTEPFCKSSFAWSVPALISQAQGPLPGAPPAGSWVTRSPASPSASHPLLVPDVSLADYTATGRELQPIIPENADVRGVQHPAQECAAAFTVCKKRQPWFIAPPVPHHSLCPAQRPHLLGISAVLLSAALKVIAYKTVGTILAAPLRYETTDDQTEAPVSFAAPYAPSWERRSFAVAA